MTTTAAARAGIPQAAARQLLTVRDLSVRFRIEGGHVLAADSVSFELAEREVLALVGESGCGKSVTAMALTRLLPRNAAVSGSVHLGERSLLELPESGLRDVRGKEIAYVFQEPMTSLNPVLTVGRQIGEVLRRHQRMRGTAVVRRTTELLELVGIPLPQRRLREYPHQLSGGMRQRVMIAMAVACRPRLLVADEPTTALDVTVQAGILDVLRELRAETGTSVLLITHDLGVVADLADRVVVMYAGRTIEEATTDAIFARHCHPYTRGLLEAVPNPERRAGGLREIPGRVPTLRDSPQACTFAERCEYADEICRRQLPLLEIGPTGHPVRCFHPLRQPPAGAGVAR
jgi:peptide/nickel transport system ATP-binding protein